MHFYRRHICFIPIINYRWSQMFQNVSVLRTYPNTDYTYYDDNFKLNYCYQYVKSIVLKHKNFSSCGLTTTVQHTRLLLQQRTTNSHVRLFIGFSLTRNVSNIITLTNSGGLKDTITFWGIGFIGKLITTKYVKKNINLYNRISCLLNEDLFSTIILENNYIAKTLLITIPSFSYNNLTLFHNKKILFFDNIRFIFLNNSVRTLKKKKRSLQRRSRRVLGAAKVGRLHITKI